MTSDILEPNTQASGNAESTRRFGLIAPAAWRYGGASERGGSTARRKGTSILAAYRDVVADAS